MQFSSPLICSLPSKSYSFSYDNSFKIKEEKFNLGVSTIIEEVGDAPHEIRYTIYRKFD